ncbi:hypothetical protein F4777DRAFT_564071 [Nemania sp. FL0916]|nr:hypothetical protein F4777DRAFT_564071 [Nemania sp. FL0916]
MGIFPGGKSTRINSPRHLTLRHSRRVTTAHRREARRLAGVLDNDEDEIDPLPPGQQKLNSYWAPGLQAGPKHTITVNQSIVAPTTPSQELSLEAEQSFFVDAPQFSLPEGSIHSTYPPPGYPDTNRILPHVVLTDPHLPWERLGSPSQGTNFELRMRMKALAAGAEGDYVRNRVPWLVIFSFSQDELRLPPEDLDGSSSIFRNTSDGVTKPVKQSATMTVNMSIDDLWKLTSDVKTPVTADLGPDSMKESRGDFIFVKPELFTNLFLESNSSGNPTKGSSPSTIQYQYLAHVRKINGQGMALAGVEDTAVFSIVVGNRAGTLDNETPATMCVHLMSIEGIENMAWPSSSHRYVALCSLHSWNYTVLPANTLNVPDAFEQLGSTLDVLRAPEEAIQPLRTSDDKLKQLVANRLDDGYTLVRYRTQTGESTVAFYRGPFTPSYVPPLENLTQSSNSGVDLQVLDKQLGIMDVTYSVAWQVGRTLALGNEGYSAALNRLRSSIHSKANAESKLQTVKDVDDTVFRTRSNVLSDIDSVVRSLASIHLGNNDDLNPGKPVRNPAFLPGGAKRRWQRHRLARSEIPDLSFSSPLIKKKYPGHAARAARDLAKSTAGDIYDETNDPLSTDWMIVLSWLLDRMFLSGVPAHCLIPDPTYLEPETLRFFRIDTNWVDALLDGALSLGNHYGDDEDRRAIKQAFNDYINHTPEGQEQAVQIPSYGFYLRSDLVTMFPDLRVEVLPDNAALAAAGQTALTGAPLLRHEIVTDGIMMAFTDRLPGSDQFSSLVFTQPAHQQRFAVARGLDPTQVKVDIRRQYTVDQSIRETDSKRHDALKQIIYKPGDPDNIFSWDATPGSGLNDLRLIWPPRFAAVQLKELQDNMGKYNNTPYFDDNAATSALFAMQLNDPIYNLTIDLNPHPKAGTMAALGPPGVSTSPEIRALRMLKPSRVTRVINSGDRPSDTPTKHPDDDDDYGATFERHKNYTVNSTTLSKYLAPNVRALPVLSLPSLSELITDPVVESGPAGTPQFQISISSNITGHWDVIQLDEHNLAQDLIFSVVIQQSEVSQYRLVEVDIQIDLGAPVTDSSAGEPHFLMENYTGPGAHMLTNLRFNVLPANVVDGGRNLLRFRLLPRSAKGWVFATTVNELSFLVGLANINAPKKHIDQFRVQSWAQYVRNISGGLDPGNILTVTNPDTLVTVVNPQYAS